MYRFALGENAALLTASKYRNYRFGKDLRKVHPRGFEPLTFGSVGHFLGSKILKCRTLKSAEFAAFFNVNSKLGHARQQSRFYRNYVRIPVVLGHFSDKQRKRPLPKGCSYISRSLGLNLHPPELRSQFSSLVIREESASFPCSNSSYQQALVTLVEHPPDL